MRTQIAGRIADRRLAADLLKIVTDQVVEAFFDPSFRQSFARAADELAGGSRWRSWATLEGKSLRSLQARPKGTMLEVHQEVEVDASRLLLAILNQVDPEIGAAFQPKVRESTQALSALASWVMHKILRDPDLWGLDAWKPYAYTEVISLTSPNPPAVRGGFAIAGIEARLFYAADPATQKVAGTDLADAAKAWDHFHSQMHLLIRGASADLKKALTLVDQAYEARKQAEAGKDANKVREAHAVLEEALGLLDVRRELSSMATAFGKGLSPLIRMDKQAYGVDL